VRRLQFICGGRQSPRHSLTRRHRLGSSASAAKVCPEFDHSGHSLCLAIRIRPFATNWQSVCPPAESFDSVQNHLSANDLPPFFAIRPLPPESRLLAAICMMQLQNANPECHSTSVKMPVSNRGASYGQTGPVGPPIEPPSGATTLECDVRFPVFAGEIPHWTRQFRSDGPLEHQLPFPPSRPSAANERTFRKGWREDRASKRLQTQQARMHWHDEPSLR
jgi:hypothetical protein